MKDWRRSPEPPGMMGIKHPSSAPITLNWGQPEELDSDFDPASPLAHTTPAFFARTRPHHRDALTTHRSGLPSLYSMCLRVILRNISSVQDLGDMPYRNAKPILEQCRIDQLIALEETSPHLLENTEEIWKRNCLRDFMEVRKKYAPSEPAAARVVAREPKSWRRLYLRTKGEIEQAKVEAAQRIKDKYAQHKAEKDAKKLVVSDRPLMLKSARSGGRRFGMMAGGGGGVSKGQSLMNKAHSRSVAQAKLTAPRGNAFRTQGRSKAVGVELAPEAAGIRIAVRPMVAPRKVGVGASEGLLRLKEFSRPLPSEVVAEEARTSSARKSAATSSSQRVESARSPMEGAVEAAGMPRLKPHEVAAAAPLTPSTCSSSIPSPGQRSSAGAQREAERTSRKQASSPPPDIARVEKRKIDFFGGGSKLSTSSSASNGSNGSDTRGLKRAHSSTTTTSTTRSVPTASSATSLQASSPTSGSMSPTSSKAGVRVVQAKRVRTTDKSDSASSPTASSSPQAGASKNGSVPSSQRANTPLAPQRPASPIVSSARPTQLRQHSYPLGGPVSRMGEKDGRMARASPAALSSVFVPSSSSPASNWNSRSGGYRG